MVYTYDGVAATGTHSPLPALSAQRRCFLGITGKIQLVLVWGDWHSPLPALPAQRRWISAGKIQTFLTDKIQDNRQNSAGPGVGG